MNVNADFSRKAVVHAAEEPWIASPMKGVDRRMLDRIGDEVARATSIVRYAPQSAFSPHVHTGGEEFLVLEGVFQDEHGDFPAGTYVRNPPQSRHTPRSDEGCTILVKLWQFDPDDRKHVVVDTTVEADYVPDPVRAGVRILPLFSDAREDVRMEIWEANRDIAIADHDGLEIFVLDGSFLADGDGADGDGADGDGFKPYSWLRLPPGERFHAATGGAGARVWIKQDHLNRPQTAPDSTPDAG